MSKRYSNRTGRGFRRWVLRSVRSLPTRAERIARREQRNASALRKRDDWHGDPFAAILAFVFGARMRRSYRLCCEVYSAVTNTEWTTADGKEGGFSFRCAGDVIAWIRGEGDYRTWYLCAGEGRVTPEIERALNAEGWQSQPM